MEQRNIPNHVGIILDGNGRWAQLRGQKRMKGHEAGAKNVIEITRACSHRGVKVLSLYAFSTENWKRPTEEVSALMKLLVQFITEYLDELNANQVQLQTMGDLKRLPIPSRSAIAYAKSRTKNNGGMILNIGLNYGGRDELCRAVSRAKNDDASHPMTEDWLASHLDTALLPDLDVLIRTGGEQRLSNFMLWQSAYAELFFVDTLWPDFSVAQLDDIFLQYARRDRRFGGVH